MGKQNGSGSRVIAAVAAICLTALGSAGCAGRVWTVYAASPGAETATLQYAPTTPSSTMWANLQFVWSGSDIEMTDATTFRNFSNAVPSAVYPEQVEAGKRLYLYTFIAQGNGYAARHCRSFISFIPAAGERYAAADHGDTDHCAIRIINQKTSAPAPGFEVHDPEPLSNQFK